MSVKTIWHGPVTWERLLIAHCLECDSIHTELTPVSETPFFSIRCPFCLTGTKAHAFNTPEGRQLALRATELQEKLTELIKGTFTKYRAPFIRLGDTFYKRPTPP